MKKLKFLLSRYLDRKKNDSFVDMKKIKKILTIGKKYGKD